MNKLKSVFKIYPFSELTKWQKFKIWIIADIPYFCDRIWYKLTGRFLLK